MKLTSCPYCGVVSIAEVMAGHTRQECEAKILARIAHHEAIIAQEQAFLDALHNAANRDRVTA